MPPPPDLCKEDTRQRVSNFISILQLSLTLTESMTRGDSSSISLSVSDFTDLLSSCSDDEFFGVDPICTVSASYKLSQGLCLLIITHIVSIKGSLQPTEQLQKAKLMRETTAIWKFVYPAEHHAFQCCTFITLFVENEFLVTESLKDKTELSTRWMFAFSHSYYPSRKTITGL